MSNFQANATVLEQQWDAALADQQQAHEAWKMDNYADGQARDEYRRANAALDRAANAFAAATSDPDQDARDDAERFARVEQEWADEAARADAYRVREDERAQAVIAENEAKWDAFEAAPEHVQSMMERSWWAPTVEERNAAATELFVYRQKVSEEELRARVREDVQRTLAAEKGDARPLKLVSATEALNAPAPSWYIPGLLIRDAVSLCAGEPGLGKSFIMLGMAAAIATGTPWLGRPTKQARVLYVLGEGANGIGARLKAWQEHSGREVGDALVLATEGVNLSDQASVSNLRGALIDGGFGVVIFDTFSQLSSLDSENDAAQVAAVMRTIEDLRLFMPSGSSAVVVHHTTKASAGAASVRGSSAFKGNVGAVIVAQRSKGGIRISTDATYGGKMRDGEASTIDNLQLLQVGGSAVVVKGAAPEVRQADVVEAVTALFTAGDTLTTGQVAEALASHHARRTVERTLSALVESGVLVKAGRGAYRVA